MGVAAADTDNDGATDVVLTSVGGVTLLRNAGGGASWTSRRRPASATGAASARAAMWFDVDATASSIC